MATASLLLLRRPLTLGLGLSSAFAAHALYRAHTRPLLCDSLSSTASNFGAKLSDELHAYQRDDGRTPVVKRGGSLNPSTVKQISGGSILGLLGGLAVSTFSRTLTIVLGLAVFGAQWLESRGIHVVPTTKVQQYFKNIDLRSAIEDNAAFKLSFGATFMLAAFARLDD